MKPVVVGVVFVVAVSVLVGVALGARIPVLTVDQLTSGDYEPGTVERHVQADGAQVVEIESTEPPLRFKIATESNPTQVISVVSPQVMPDNFRVGIPVSVRGAYDPKTNEFTAYRVTTKCPSRYEASSEAKEYDTGRVGGYGAPESAPPATAPADALPLPPVTPKAPVD